MTTAKAVEEPSLGETTADIESLVHDQQGFPPDRLKTLVDGVFAIAMTLLALEIRLPEIANENLAAELPQALAHLIPSFRGYFISFIILGIYWVGHHNLFHFIKKVDRVMLWLTVLMLLLISLVPFSASLIGKYGDFPLSVAVYGIHLTLTGIVVYLNWVYATRHHHLVDHSVPEKLVISVKKHLLLTPAVYALGVVLALNNHPTISMIIFVIVPVYYILPNRLDRHLPGRNEHRH